MTLKALLLILDYDTYCKVYIDKIYTIASVRELLTYDSTLHIKQILGVKHQTSYLVIKLGSLRRGIDD